MSAQTALVCPEWSVEKWFNTDTDLTVSDMRGKVVVIEAFQMLCPGCVLHGIPQAQRIQAYFPADDVQVIGLHTVFEHHGAMEPHALEVFLHEYRITFPVGVDRPSETGPTPQTMQSWGQRGTPTLWLIDRNGRVRAEHLGQSSDMEISAQIAALVAERVNEAPQKDERASQPGAWASATGGVCQPPSSDKNKAETGEP